MKKYQNLMALASISVASLITGCASDNGYESAYPDLASYQSETERAYLPGTASKIERQVLLQKKYIPATEDIIRAEKAKQRNMAENAGYNVNAYYIGGDHYVDITGEKNGVPFTESWKNQELMFATKTRTVLGLTSDKQKYRATITETYQNGDYLVDSYGSVGGVVFGESWLNGSLQNGNESYSVNIVNGVLMRENMPKVAETQQKQENTDKTVSPKVAPQKVTTQSEKVLPVLVGEITLVKEKE